MDQNRSLLSVQLVGISVIGLGLGLGPRSQFRHRVKFYSSFCAIGLLLVHNIGGCGWNLIYMKMFSMGVAGTNLMAEYILYNTGSNDLRNS